jgi:tetratricopeptide (TPR) repeat protein
LKTEDASIFADDRFNLMYLVLLICLFLLETASLFLIQAGSWFLLIHLAVCVIPTMIVFFALKIRLDMRLPAFIWIAVVLFGPFGSLGMCSFLIFYSIFKRLSTPFEKWYTALFPDFQLSPAGKIYERIVAGWDDYKTHREIISFQDLMQVGTVQQKQSVLEMIAQNFNPILAPILKMGLEDSSNQIRVQSASIISKIERDFEMKKKTLLKELEKDPGHPATLFALAEHLDAYAFSGIIDFFRERESREMAIEYYRKYIDKRPEDHKAWMALGRLLNRLNAFDKVLDWFEEQMKKSSASIPISSYTWYWEALYMLHNFNKLSSSAQAVYREILKSNPQKEILECIQLWASREE